MAYAEFFKNGALVKRQEVDEAAARRGISIRVGSAGKVRLSLGETKVVPPYEVRLLGGPIPSDDRTSARNPPVPRLDGYQVLSRLGEGGMGVVWKATQLSTRRPVALKFLRLAAFGSDKSQRRFEREVELSARLEHPNIARIYDSGLRHGVHYYAMELIDGDALDEYVKNTMADTRRILELMAVVCSAVDHAHQHGVVHRDLKPSNIL